MDGHYFILFDIPREEAYFRVKIHRLLAKLGAEMVQHSTWKSARLDDLVRIAGLIKNIGGKARIMEEKLVFE